MPLFTPYFSLDSSAFRVGNGGRLRCRMGASGIGIYVMLLSHLRDCRDCRAPLDYDMLAFDLHEDAAAVRRVVEDFGLFDIDRSSGTFTSSVLTTVRGMLSDDASAAGGGTVRTVRQRRVRSAGETYRRAVRRLAEDNALPPAEEEAPAEGDAEPAEETPTSSQNAITPADAEHPFAEEANATGAFAPTSIAAEGTPAEVKHESADAEGTPAEVEDQPAEETNATGDFADARSPRTEEKRTEQNKKPHTPIVPFPQSGKGTRASHPAPAVVGEREEGAASAVGDEESVVGSPRFVSSAVAHADAPRCAATPTVLDAPARTLDPHPSPDTANGRTSAEKEETSVPNSQFNTLTASEEPAHPNPDAENGTTSAPNSQPNTLTTSEAPAHPQTDTAKADTSVPNSQADTANGQTSAEKMETSMPNSQPNILIASEAPAHPQTDGQNGQKSVPNAQANPENGQTSAENGQMSMPNSQPNTLTTSEKDNEAGRGEEGAGEPFVPPTANEVRRFAEALRHPEFDAEWFVAYYTERHWRRHNGRPVVSWQTTARYWLDHPLRVARHLLGHRPAASPVSVGVGGPSAVVVPAACPAAAPTVAGSASSPSTGTPPVCTGGLSPRASASSTSTGTPHVGSLSLPAPTPLQQSRLSDLKGMVLHLFADAPAAAPTSATAAPELSSAAADVPASAPTPATAASPSVHSPRFISPAEAAQVIAQQTLAAAEAEAVRRVGERRATDSEEEARIGEISPADAAKDIDAQALSPADAKEYVRACDDSTDENGEEARIGEISPADAANAVDAQLLSPADAKEYVHACNNSTTDTAKRIDAQVLSPADAEEYVRSCDDSTTDAAKAVDAQVLSPADAEESVRACDNSTDEEEEGIDTQAFSIPDAAKGIDAQALSPVDAKEYVCSCDDSTDEDGEEARVGEISPADAAKDIDAQAFSTADATKAIDAQAFSPADAEEKVETQAFSTTDTAKDIDAQAFSTTDTAKGIDAQAFSTDKGRWGVRSPRGPDPPTGDGHDSTDAGNDFADTGNDFADTGNDFADAENHFTAQPSNFSADRHSPAAVGTARTAVGTARAADPPIFADDECRSLRILIEKHPYLNPSFHEPHPLLRLHPPSFGGFGRTFRVQSAQPPFGRPFLGRFVDIRPACTVGSRPLRPRLTLCRTERGRCRLEHPDRECTTSANAIRPPADEPEHGIDGRKRHDPAPEHPADAAEHGTDGRKNADFIDADPVRGHKTERNEPEHPADERKQHDPAPEHPADGHEHDAQRAKNADFIDADPAYDPEHLDRGCKRHDSAPEHPANAVSTPADECPDPAYDPDAGQRVLRSAAHRRAVRAEREACCGALRHLAHCCVAF